MQLKILANCHSKALSLYTLRQLALKLNFEARSVKADSMAFMNLSKPAIALIRNQSSQLHFVVLNEIKGALINVMDPAIGRIKSYSLKT